MRILFLASAAAAAALAGLSLEAAPARAQSGSYVRSCRNIRTHDGFLTAECADEGGRFRMSTLPFTLCRSEISNINGMLTCRGAVATPGPFAGAAPPPPPGAAGPGPVFGDPRYGDPRYDWRYAQGGWGYGRRPGEWVPIRDRAPWLDERIQRAVRDGRLSRDAARDLHRSVDRLEDMEADMMRSGRYGPRERADLDRRWDDLAARFRDQRAY